MNFAQMEIRTVVRTDLKEAEAIFNKSQLIFFSPVDYQRLVD